MKTIGIFYGSSTGTTEDIAKRIAAKLGVDASNLYDGRRLLLPTWQVMRF